MSVALIDELRPALDHWELARVTSIARATSGTMNDTFLLRAGTDRAVLRRHRHRDRHRALREHALIAHVCGRGISAPAARRTRTGALVVEVDSRLYSMFDHARGRQVPRGDLGVGQARSFGETLARIHDALADAEPVTTPAAPPEPPGRADTIARLTELLALARARPDPQPSDEWAVRRMRDRIAWLSSLPDRPVADGGVRQVIHGDYQESNVFFDAEDQVCAVIDWDKSELGHPGTEVVRAMALTFALDPDLCRAFLAGYRTRRPATAADLDDAAGRYGADKAHDTWVYDRVYRDGDVRPRRFIQPGPYVPFEQQWQRVRDRLM